MPGWMRWTIALLVAAALLSIGWRYMWVLVTLHVLVCVVLVIVIMLQSGSAADLAGAFGGAGSQTAFGPRGAASFLSRATTWCAIVFMASSLTLSIRRVPSEAGGSGSVLEETTNPKAAPAKPGAPATTPALPTQVPAMPAPQAPAAPAQPSTTPTPATPAPTQQK